MRLFEPPQYKSCLRLLRLFGAGVLLFRHRVPMGSGLLLEWASGCSPASAGCWCVFGLLLLSLFQAYYWIDLGYWLHIGLDLLLVLWLFAGSLPL